jgi:hypothetical protein
MADVWNAVSAISSAVSALIVLAAALYAKGQVGEARRTREVALLQNVYERYHERDLREFRSRLGRGEIDESNLSNADKELLKQNLNTLEFLAIAVENELLDFDLVHSVFADSPPKMYSLATRIGWAGKHHQAGPLGRFVTRYPQRPSDMTLEGSPWDSPPSPALEASS